MNSVDSTTFLSFPNVAKFLRAYKRDRLHEKATRWTLKKL